MKRHEALKTPSSFRTSIAAAALIVFGCAATTASGQSPERSRFLHWTYQDAAMIVRDFGASAPVATLAGAVILVPFSRLDDPVLRQIQSQNHGPLGSFLKVSNQIGGPKALPVMAGVFAVSLTTRDTKFQDAAFTSFQSLVFAGAMSTGLKMAFGRYRPETGSDAYHFDSFSGNTSFPSGHTTSAFAIITPWVMYYPGVASYSLFLLSTGTAVARIANDKHWPTDVLAGAAIGFLTGRYLAGRHLRDRPDGTRIDMGPAFTDNGAGLSIHIRLP